MEISRGSGHTWFSCGYALGWEGKPGFCCWFAWLQVDDLQCLLEDSSACGTDQLPLVQPGVSVKAELVSSNDVLFKVT